MAAHVNDRNKASRIRKLGAAASEPQRAWLAAYDADRANAPRGRRAPNPGASSNGRTVDFGSAYGGSNPSAPMPQLPPPAASIPSEPAPEGFGRLQWDAPPETHDPNAQATTCGVPGCPACAGNLGARRCVATGKLVFKPMKPAAARMLAAGILMGVSIVVRFIRKDKLVVIPNSKEVEDLGDAILDIQQNHFTWIGAGSEFWSFLVAIGQFGKRAYAQKPETEGVRDNAPVGG